MIQRLRWASWIWLAAALALSAFMFFGASRDDGLGDGWVAGLVVLSLAGGVLSSTRAAGQWRQGRRWDSAVAFLAAAIFAAIFVVMAADFYESRVKGLSSGRFA